MQTLFSPTVVSSLSIPKKPTTFLENPLDRTEIESPEDHPLVRSRPASFVAPMTPGLAVKAPEKDIPGTQSTPAVFPLIPPLRKPEKPSVASVNDTPPVLRPPTPPRPILNSNPKIPALPRNDASVAETPTKRKLPDEIKEIFESNSKDFVAYAKNTAENGENKKKSDIPPPPKKPADEMSEWDRALLFGEYPPKRQKPKRLAFSEISIALVPQKADTAQKAAAFPSRVMDEEIASPKLRFHPVVRPYMLPTSGEQDVPQKSENPPRNIPIPSTPLAEKIAAIPQSSPLASSAPSFIPRKPNREAPPRSAQILPPFVARSETENPAIPSANMSETLVEKIIEGQMRGVFENAPSLLQKELEKAMFREVIYGNGEQPSQENIKNDVWKKRLREYLLKLQEQALSAFPNTTVANPVEGELVLDYIKRVYPLLLKAEITK